MHQKLNKLYKRTSTGAIQEWYLEIHKDGDKYRTVSGQIDGKKIESGWKEAKGKNIGKANETTPQAQCQSEVDSLYRKKLERGQYHKNVQEIDQANFFSPMLAKKWQDYEELFTGEQWAGVYSQPKLDGIRCIISAFGMWSRNGLPLVSAPHIFEALKPFFKANPDAILDGELYADKLHDDFQKILSLARKETPTAEELAESAKYLKIYLYDFPSVEGSFGRRYENLTKTYCQVFTDAMRNVSQLVITTHVKNKAHLDELYGEYMEFGYEGQMVRTDDGRYACKRHKQLLKRKEFEDGDFNIKDITEGKGNWAGLAKSIMIELPDGQIQKAGMRGNRAFARQLLEKRVEYINTITTVNYQKKSNDGLLIFPVCVKFYGTKKRDV